MPSGHTVFHGSAAEPFLGREDGMCWDGAGAGATCAHPGERKSRVDLLCAWEHRVEMISASGQGLTVALGPVGSSLHCHSGIWDLPQGQILAKLGSLSQEIISFQDVLGCAIKPTTSQSSSSVRDCPGYGTGIMATLFLG